MPLLDIPSGKPSLPSNVIRAQTLLHNVFVFGNDKRLASGCKSFQLPKIGVNCNLGSNKARWGALVIRAVATLEPESSVESVGGQDGGGNLCLGVDSGSVLGIRNQSSSEDSEELRENEKLRRKRISKANKGRVPWNKGKKHSPETRQLIKERTWIAMQNVKVREKLANHGHAQSQETRMKIGAGVRLGWFSRRKKRRLQETCYFDWQNLIADASRRGLVGQEELQWDSYKMLTEQLQQEWLESIELRKQTPRRKGNRKAPKTPEQREKISAAIAAKWAEPEYRERVHSALKKYHGSRVRVEKKTKKQPSADRQVRPPSPPKKKVERAIQVVKLTKSPKYNSTKPLRRNKPQYKDPMASSKLEMIKNIRAQRAAADTKKTEAIVQAKLLIAEAEMAAKALEAAAMKSPVAQASLIETRKLIAEAIQSLQSIENGRIHSDENDVQNPSVASAELVNNHMEKESIGKINGTQALEPRESDNKDFGFTKFNFQYLLNGEDEVLPTKSCNLLDGKEELYQTGSSDSGWSPSELNSVLKQSGITEQLSQLEPNGKNSLQEEVSELNSVLKQSGITEQLSQLEPNGKNSLQEEVPSGGAAELKPEKEVKPPSSITVTKKWVRGKLVEVGELD